MNKDFAYLIRLYTWLANYLVLNAAFVLGLIFRFRDDWLQVFGSNNYVALLLFINLSWVMISNLLRYYRPARLTVKWSRRWFIFLQIGLLHLLLVLAFNGIIKTYYSRLFFIYFYIQIFTVLPLLEMLVRSVLAWYQRSQGITNRIALIGQSSALKDLEHYFRNQDAGVHQREVVVVNGSLEQLPTEIKNLHENQTLHELYCSLANIPEPVLKQIGTYCENNLIRIRLVMDYPRWETKPLEIVHLDSIPVINVPVTPLDEPGNKIIKRVFDAVFSLLVLVLVLSWLFPLLAILIKISSRGPVIFRQKRTGLDKREFDCFKFRSMRVNLDADEKQATENDPRITRIGSFMRKTSLDELPQFINVLNGEMSVVGPRPHMLKHTEEYGKLVGNFMQRHAIKPGVTGLAQVKGYRGEITHFEHLANRVKYDRFYVENWSLTLDLKIVLLTVLTVVRSR